jgi:hypothetical protein
MAIAQSLLIPTTVAQQVLSIAILAFVALPSTGVLRWIKRAIAYPLPRLDMLEGQRCQRTTPMAISKTEAKQLLERLIFEDERPQDWVQDVWGLSPMLGDSAAKLFEVFEALLECCSEEELENLLQTWYQNYIQE